jgi:hypothetical protein
VLRAVRGRSEDLDIGREPPLGELMDCIRLFAKLLTD